MSEAGPIQTRYEYDGLNRLVRVTYAGGLAVSYQYDAAGNLTGTTVEGGPAQAQPPRQVSASASAALPPARPTPAAPPAAPPGHPSAPAAPPPRPAPPTPAARPPVPAPLPPPSSGFKTAPAPEPAAPTLLDVPATLITEETFALHPLRLTELEGPEPGRVFTLAKSGEAGRHPECDVPLPDGHVSRHHARFALGPDGVWRVEDAGSANGTRVNEEEIEAATALTDGDLVHLSTVVLKVNLRPQGQPSA